MSQEYQTTVGPIDKDNSFVRYDNSVLILGYFFTVIWSPYQLRYPNKIIVRLLGQTWIPLLGHSGCHLGGTVLTLIRFFHGENAETSFS